MKKTVCSLLAALILQGCSRSPSVADVETAIKSSVADCPNLAIENVEILNGIAIDERTHQIQARYDRRVVPVAQETIDHARNLAEEREAELKVIHDRAAEAEARYEQLLKQSDELSKETSSELAAAGIAVGTPGYNERYAQLMEQRGATKISEEKQALNAEIYCGTSCQQPETKIISLKDEWGTDSCIMRSGINFIGHPNAIDDAVSNGLVNTYDVTFMMIKSDNGWIASK